MEAGFEGTVCAWSWLSPTLGWQKFKQARWEGAPSPDLETSADHMSSPEKASMLSALWGSFRVTYREKETPCQAQSSYLCLSVGQERFG